MKFFSKFKKKNKQDDIYEFPELKVDKNKIPDSVKANRKKLEKIVKIYGISEIGK